MAATHQDILDRVVFVSGLERTAVDPANLLGSTGLAGDDADEFIIWFMDTYDVNMDGFLNYMHYDANEPPGRGTRGVGKDGVPLADIPISADDLVSASEAGRWTITYPDHTVGKRGAGINPLIMIALLVTVSVVIGVLTR